ncbi:chromosome partitioning protein ParA [Shewanella scandinavica]|uniref:chromosome partitioning protein ParA n=1 Tax=Shewanella TaxID=22 RepID=UPI003196388E
MEVLIYWISKVPNVIWSAIIASCLTFFGVYLTNKGNAKRQASVLLHEKEKFQFEQKLALKKEVFLNVASSFADVLGVIPRLMNLDMSEKDINKNIEGHSGIVAKSYLAAKEESVADILNYSAEIAESLLILMKERAILLEHKKAIEIYQSTIATANAEKNRILLMMKEFNFQGRKDPNTFDYLSKSYETQENIVVSSTTAMEKQKAILGPLNINYARQCIKEHGRLLSLLPPMTIALRKELDNDGDSDVFVTALNNNISRMNKAFGGLFNEAET